MGLNPALWFFVGQVPYLNPANITLLRGIINLLTKTQLLPVDEPSFHLSFDRLMLA